MCILLTLRCISTTQWRLIDLRPVLAIVWKSTREGVTHNTSLTKHNVIKELTTLHMYAIESKLLDNNHILTSFAINIHTKW